MTTPTRARREVSLDGGPSSLEGRVALVAGASGALGAAVARELDSVGAHVALHYSNSRDRADAVLDTLTNRSCVVGADLAEWDQTRDMVEAVEHQLGRVEVLVNSAAIRKDTLMAMQGVEEWQRTIDVNLVGTFHVCRAVVPRMMKGRWGRIVNVASPAGLIASPGQTAYSASKAGVIGMTRSLAAECGRRGVTANVLSPGFMQTALTESVPSEVQQMIELKLAVPRFGLPVEMARAVTFIAGSPYMTGQVLSIDGGLSIT